MLKINGFEYCPKEVCEALESRGYEIVKHIFKEPVEYGNHGMTFWEDKTVFCAIKSGEIPSSKNSLYNVARKEFELIIEKPNLLAFNIPNQKIMIQTDLDKHIAELKERGWEIKTIPAGTIVNAAHLKEHGWIYEDELPDNMRNEDYSAWFNKSAVIDGVRMGPNRNENG